MKASVLDLALVIIESGRFCGLKSVSCLLVTKETYTIIMNESLDVSAITFTLIGIVHFGRLISCTLFRYA